MKTIIFLLLSLSAFSQGLQNTVFTTESKSRKKDWKEHLYWCIEFQDNGVAYRYSRVGITKGGTTKLRYTVSGDTLTVYPPINPDPKAPNDPIVFLIEDKGTSLRDISLKGKRHYRKEKTPGELATK